MLEEQVETIPAASEFASQIWATVVWNDPINLMDYVQAVFQRHFGFSQARAHELMLQVHLTGRALVSKGPKERMEADVLAMHGYGLRSTLEPVTEVGE
ncbi:ATP-dependent Clp protease adapter ClpS [Gleimia coleocanis]